MSCSTALARVRQGGESGIRFAERISGGFAVCPGSVAIRPFRLWDLGLFDARNSSSRRETNNQVVTGSGNLTVKSRRIELISWVPLRNPSEVPVPPSSRRRLTKLGLILRHGRSAATARRWLEGRVSIPLYEIDLAHLVARAALKCGISPQIAKLVRH